MIEIWSNGKETLTLNADRENYWYFKVYPNDSTLYIAGINLYWLLNNNYKFIKSEKFIK